MRRRVAPEVAEEAAEVAGMFGLRVVVLELEGEETAFHALRLHLQREGVNVTEILTQWGPTVDE